MLSASRSNDGRNNLLTPEQTAARLGVRTTTLATWRSRGNGPKFIKIGQGPIGRIRYRNADIEDWLASNMQGM